MLDLDKSVELFSKCGRWTFSIHIPGNLLQVQVLSPHPRPRPRSDEWETLGVDPVISTGTSLPDDSNACFEFANYWISECCFRVLHERCHIAGGLVFLLSLKCEQCTIIIISLHMIINKYMVESKFIQV